MNKNRLSGAFDNMFPDYTGGAHLPSYKPGSFSSALPSLPGTTTGTTSTTPSSTSSSSDGKLTGKDWVGVGQQAGSFFLGATQLGIQTHLANKGIELEKERTQMMKDYYQKSLENQSKAIDAQRAVQEAAIQSQTTNLQNQTAALLAKSKADNEAATAQLQAVLAQQQSGGLPSTPSGGLGLGVGNFSPQNYGLNLPGFPAQGSPNLTPDIYARPQKASFLGGDKKKLLIVGGALAVVALGFLLFKKNERGGRRLSGVRKRRYRVMPLKK